jgi:hypothetical protein
MRAGYRAACEDAMNQPATSGQGRSSPRRGRGTDIGDWPFISRSRPVIPVCSHGFGAQTLCGSGTRPSDLTRRDSLLSHAELLSARVSRCRDDHRMRCDADRPRMKAAAATTAPGTVRLAQVATWLSGVDASCNRCPRRGRLHTAPLVAEHDADMPMPTLLRILPADCPRIRARHAHDACGAHLPPLATLGM